MPPQLRAWVAETIGGRYAHELSLWTETAREVHPTPEHALLHALSPAMAKGFGVDGVERMGNAGGPRTCFLRPWCPCGFFGTGLVEDTGTTATRVRGPVFSAQCRDACPGNELGTADKRKPPVQKNEASGMYFGSTRGWPRRSTTPLGPFEAALLRPTSGHRPRSGQLRRRCVHSEVEPGHSPSGREPVPPCARPPRHAAVAKWRPIMHMAERARDGYLAFRTVP